MKPITLSGFAIVSGLVLGLVSLDSPAGVLCDCGDIDGIVDALDNCSLVVNGPALPATGCTNQQDGLTSENSNEPDGYGTVCDTDFNNNGATDAADLGAMLSAFSSVSTHVDKDLNCNGAADAMDLRATLTDFSNVQTPGPSGLACAGTVPCP